MRGVDKLIRAILVFGGILGLIIGLGLHLSVLKVLLAIVCGAISFAVICYLILVTIPLVSEARSKNKYYNRAQQKEARIILAVMFGLLAAFLISLAIGFLLIPWLVNYTLLVGFLILAGVFVFAWLH